MFLEAPWLLRRSSLTHLPCGQHLDQPQHRQHVTHDAAAHQVLLELNLGMFCKGCDLVAGSLTEETFIQGISC